MFLSKAEREARAKAREEEARHSAAAAAAARAKETHALIEERRAAEVAARLAYEAAQAREREREEAARQQDEAQERMQREALRKPTVTRGVYTKAERREFYSRGTQTADEIVRERRRARYLGEHKDERRYRKAADVEKARKLMEWDARDDTTIADSIVYGGDDDLDAVARAHALLPLFGRGSLGGIAPGVAAAPTNPGTVAPPPPEHVRARATAGTAGTKTTTTTSARGGGGGEPASRHWSLKRLDEMTARDWRIFKEDFSITTRGGSIPNPIRAWDESGIAEPVLRAIREQGWARPTPIQMAAIPIGLQFRDVVGVAETGSGKTAAFVVPMLAYIACMPALDERTQLNGPYALVMAPSRELILQIRDEIVRLARYTRVRVVSLIGGERIEDQGLALRAGCEAVVATPARLLDCLQQRYVVLSQCCYLVLDEADRMVAMGFEKQLNAVLDAMPATNLKSLDDAEAARQESEQARLLLARARTTAGAQAAADALRGHIYRTTIMFSATMPPAIERLARKYLRRAAQVVVGEVGRVTDNVEQRVLWTPTEHSKRQHLRELLAAAAPPIMIFLNQKKAVDTLVRALVRDGWPRTVALHSSRTEEQRQNALAGFKDGRYDILVATDVAARGIDVSGVQLVVNYEMPRSIDDYTHRVGRTGRAGHRGIAASFLTPDDTDIMYDLRNALAEAHEPIPPELANNPAALPRDPKSYLRKKDQVIRAPNT